jgi:hypothetical protein
MEIGGPRGAEAANLANNPLRVKAVKTVAQNFTNMAGTLYEAFVNRDGS